MKKRFGKYVQKAQTGMEANQNNPNQNTNKQNNIDWAQMANVLMPMLMNYTQNQSNKNLQKNTYNSNDPFYTKTMYSPYATNYALGQQNQQEKQIGQMGTTALSIGLNAVVPGLGLVVPAAEMLNESIVAPHRKQKYGITYYDNDLYAMGEASKLSNRMGDMFTWDNDPNKTTAGNILYNTGNFLTAGSLGVLKAKKKNQEAKDKIKELEGLESQQKQMHKDLTQGIYAKKGIHFGKYTMQQLQNIPKHSDKKVIDTIENKEYPALEKGAGGAVIPFGKGNQKKKVLVENGEYIVKDEEGEIIGVLPKKIGEKVLSGKITLEEAFDKVPDVNEAETAKVMQEGGVDEQEQDTERQNFTAPVPPYYNQNQEQKLTINSLIYSNNPILSALLNQPYNKKLTAKKGIVNTDGYLQSSKNVNNPVNIIKSNIITTEGMAFPIYANGKLLYPNTGVYKFKEQYVVETPAMRCGGKHKFGKYAVKAQQGYYPSKEDIEERAQYQTDNIELYLPETNAFMKNVKDPTNKDLTHFADADATNRPTNSTSKSISLTERIKQNPNNFKAIDPNTAFSYGLGLFQLWKAYNAKPSVRGAYTYSPEIDRILGQKKYYEKYGDQQGYKEALRNIESQRIKAMRDLQTKTSSGSYLNTVASMSSNLANAQNEARNKFITQEQKMGRADTAQYVANVYQPAQDKVFNDALLRYKEHQDFLNNREKAIMGSLQYINNILQNRKTNAIQQYNEYFKQMDAYNKELLEYKLLYGTPEEKQEAKYLLEHPEMLYSRPTPKYFGFYQPYKRPFGKYNKEIDK